MRAHPATLAAAGAADGSNVRVSSGRGSLELPAVADADLPATSVVVAFNIPGAGAGELIDSRQPVTTVTLQRVSAADPVEPVGGAN